MLKAQLDELGNKCQQQDDIIKQLREELVSKQVNPAHNHMTLGT